MSANQKRLVCLAFGILLSIIAGLVWGLVLSGMKEPVAECVKAGGAAFGGTFMVSLAVIMLFPFKDGHQADRDRQTPPSNRTEAPTA